MTRSPEEILGVKVTAWGIEQCPLDEAEVYRLPAYNATVPRRLVDVLGIDRTIEWLQQ